MNLSLIVSDRLKTRKDLMMKPHKREWLEIHKMCQTTPCTIDTYQKKKEEGVSHERATGESDFTAISYGLDKFLENRISFFCSRAAFFAFDWRIGRRQWNMHRYGCDEEKNQFRCQWYPQVRIYRVHAAAGGGWKLQTDAPKGRIVFNQVAL